MRRTFSNEITRQNLEHLELKGSARHSILGSFYYNGAFNVFVLDEYDDYKNLLLYKTKDFTSCFESIILKVFNKNEIVKLVSLNGIYYLINYKDKKFFCYSIEPFVEENFELIENLSSFGRTSDLNVIDFTIFYSIDRFYVLLVSKNDENEAETRLYSSANFKDDYKLIKNFGSLFLIDETVSNLSSYKSFDGIYVLYDSIIKEKKASRVIVLDEKLAGKFDISAFQNYSELNNEESAFFIQGKKNEVYVSSIFYSNLASKFYLTLPKILSFEKGKIFKKPAKLILNRINSVSDLSEDEQISKHSLIKIEANEMVLISFLEEPYKLNLLFNNQQIAISCNDKCLKIINTKQNTISLFVLIDDSFIEVGINKGKEFIVFDSPFIAGNMDVNIINRSAITNFHIGNFKND